MGVRMRLVSSRGLRDTGRCFLRLALAESFSENPTAPLDSKDTLRKRQYHLRQIPIVRNAASTTTRVKAPPYLVESGSGTPSENHRPTAWEGSWKHMVISTRAIRAAVCREARRSHRRNFRNQSRVPCTPCALRCRRPRSNDPVLSGRYTWGWAPHRRQSVRPFGRNNYFLVGSRSV